MRPMQHTLSGLALALAALAVTPVTASGASTPAATLVSTPQVTSAAQAARSGSLAKPQRFARRTVRTVRGVNSITVSWPRRANTTGYWVTWAPGTRAVPATPATCRYPCERKWTRGTSMKLSSGDLSTSGRRVSSASGNTVRFKVFSYNGRLNWTGTTYPYDSWIGPARTATTNWLPVANAQMPLPLPPSAGRTAAISSFNILAASSRSLSWRTRAPRLVAQFNRTGSSIVATQEASNSATGVGGSTNQFTDLASRLRPSGWALADGRNWDYTMGLRRSHSTQAVRTYYKTSQWRQVSNGALMTHVPVSGQTSGINVDRWVSWTKLASTADSSTKVCVLNAHLMTNIGGYNRTSANHRAHEVAQILSELNNPNSSVRRVGTRVGSACSGTPTVVAGDFNAAQDHPPYGNAQQGTFLSQGFVDTKNAATRTYTKYSGTGPISRWHDARWGTQIDYILTKGMGGAHSFKVNAVTPSGAGSDHYPITAVVNIPRS